MTIRRIAIIAAATGLLIGAAFAIRVDDHPLPQVNSLLGGGFTSGGGFAGGGRGGGCRGMTPSSAWPRRTIYTGLDGADGTNPGDWNGDGRGDLVVPWEEDDTVTVHTHPGFWSLLANPSLQWTTLTCMTGLVAPEDAYFAALGDGDTQLDVIAASEGSGGSLRLSRGPTCETTRTIDTGKDWIKLATGDINEDGELDIVAGSKTDPVAEVGIFFAPADPWSGSWTYLQVSEGSWVLSVHVGDYDEDGDLDIASADRECYNPGSGNVCDLVGTKWFENTDGSGGTWELRTIRNTGVGQSRLMNIADMDGDGDLDVVHCAAIAGPTNTLYFSRNGTDGTGGAWSSSTTWTTVPIASPTGLGQCYDIYPIDFNRDGEMDVVISADDSTEGPSTRSGVVGLYGPDFTVRQEISGPGTALDGAGDKFDNITPCDYNHDGWTDLCTTEQHADLGVVAYENPRVCP